MDQNEFKQNAENLLDQLKQRLDALALKAGAPFVEKFNKAVADVKADLAGGKTAEAQGKYDKIIAKLDQAETSVESEPLAVKLLVLQFCYLALLAAVGYFIHRYPEFFLWKSFVTLSLKTVWFGALGGVSIAVFGIYTHIQRKNFDPAYRLWYICKPVMGGIFGWFVYLIYFLGFAAVQGFDNAQFKTPEVAYLISFLAGFSERFTIRMIDKMMAVLTTFEKEGEEDKTKENP